MFNITVENKNLKRFRESAMVLNNDPRKVLELFNKPVDRDEDEFLDNINSQVWVRETLQVTSL